MKLSVLVPAYHEEQTIGKVLERVLSVDAGKLGVEMEVVVCDDGSRDGTARQVQRVQERRGGICLVAHTHNRGKGAAIRSALEVATGDYVLIQDADLEYDVLDYPAMLEAVRAGADVVYGSRFLEGRYPRGMHPANYFANKMLTATANLLFGLRITDEATCLKLFRTELLRSLDLRCQRFEFCPEVTAKLGLLGVPIAEVPIHYHARSVHQGKKVRWTDGVQAMRTLVSHWRNPRLPAPRWTPLPANASG